MFICGVLKKGLSYKPFNDLCNWDDMKYLTVNKQ